MCLMNAINNFYGAGVIAWGGSRGLSGILADHAAQAARQLVADGRSIITGCATGADSVMVAAGYLPNGQGRYLATGQARYLAPGVTVAAVFDSSGYGACPVSNLAGVLRFGATGPVVWMAGGSTHLPLAARLRNRTRFIADRATAGALVCFGSHKSAGTALLARSTARLGRRVVALAYGPVSALPLIGHGYWMPVCTDAPATVAAWIPSQFIY